MQQEIAARAKTRGGAARRDSDTRFDPRVAAPLIAIHAAGLAIVWTGVSRGAVRARLARGERRADGTPLVGRQHRRHHRYSDRAGDPHSPVTDGLLWAQIGWLLCRRHVQAPLEEITDFARFPELLWLDRWHAAAPLALGASVYAFGAALAIQAPSLGTSGAQLLVVGFIWSTMVLDHVTYAVNALAHRFGSQRYDAGDGSRNNPWLALVTLGDGWHNNHHRFPKAARLGFFWWEIDATWIALRGLAALGLVWELAPVPVGAYATRFARRASHESAAITAMPHTTPNESPTRT